MKTFSKVMMVLMMSSVAVVSANAAISYGAPGLGQPYVGVKASQVDTKLVGAPKSMAYGVYGGYNLNQNFGAEVELQRSEKKTYQNDGFEYQYDVKTYGAYGTYRYHFADTPLYVKGKLGVAQTNLRDQSKSAGYNYTSGNKANLAGGAGVGFAPNANFGIEASYNYLSEHANAITVGAHLAF